MAVFNTFLICTRTISDKGEFISEPGDSIFLRVSSSKKSFTPADQISKSRWKKAVIAAADGDEDKITGLTGNILFFVHGYNNDIQTVLWRMQKMLSAQGWRGLVVGFDWPSA